MAGLVMSLLAITHSQWTHCNNGILHAKNSQGLHTQEARNLQTAIDQQFQSGLEGLHLCDCNLIEQDQESIQHMLGTSKQAGLVNI